MSKLFSSIQDNYVPINRGFASAIRSREFFTRLNDIIVFMSDQCHAIDPTKQRSQTLFLETEFKQKDISLNWSVIKILYSKGLAPIRVTNVPDGVSREEAEYQQLRSAIDIVLPANDQNHSRDNILAFSNFFKSRPIESVDSDASECIASMEAICLTLVSYLTKAEADLKKVDPVAALNSMDARKKSLKNLFAASENNVVHGVSDQLFNAVFNSTEVLRVPFLAGEDLNSIDYQTMGGLHSRGLNVFMGTSGAGKTLFMTSLIANHLLDAFKKEKEMPHFWIYVGEDGADSFVKRILCNIMNRLKGELGIGDVKLSDFNPPGPQGRVKEIAQELYSIFFVNIKFILPPKKPEEMLRFSVLSILSIMEAWIDAGHQKPTMVLLDYFGLLNLPLEVGRRYERPREMAEIAHQLDSWGERHKVCVLTAVQSSIGGVVGSREMKFLEQEDQAESKSIINSTRLMISILPYEQEDKAGFRKSWMAMKVIKNRGGPKNSIFNMPLDYSTNTVLTDSKMMSEVEWEIHKNSIIESKRDNLATALGANGFGKSGGNKPQFGNKGKGTTSFFKKDQNQQSSDKKEDNQTTQAGPKDTPSL